MNPKGEPNRRYKNTTASGFCSCYESGTPGIPGQPGLWKGIQLKYKTLRDWLPGHKEKSLHPHF